MVKWTPKSEEDLLGISEYIKQKFSQDIAFRVIEEIIDFAESTLSKNPLAGRILESNPLFSKIIFEGNSIYYCENPKDKNIYIVYVQARKMDMLEDRINQDEVA